MGLRAQADDAGAKHAPQAMDESGEKNAAKARAALDAMVKAMGGDAWLNMKNMVREGHIAAFFHGNPDPGTTLFWDFHEWPDRDRVEYTKHRDVVQFYEARKGIEVTYRGAKPLPQEQVDDFMRRRDHSIETAVKVWLKDPKTILVYEGQRMAERHMAEQVTMISPENEAITIQMDVQTHLPLSGAFSGAIRCTRTRTRTSRSTRIITTWMGSRQRSRSRACITMRRCGSCISTRCTTTRI